jgi:hypothetical protein
MKVSGPGKGTFGLKISVARGNSWFERKSPMPYAAQVLQLSHKYREDTAANLGRFVRIRSLSGQER